MSRARECGTKTRFESRERAAGYIQRRGAELSPGVRAYPCRWGEHWHVGHAGGGTGGRTTSRRRRGRRRA